MTAFGAFRRALLGAALGATLLGTPASAQQTVNIQAVTQPNPGIPQWTRVDIPMLREGLPQRSNGRIRVTLASWPERNLNGPEIVRLVRSGQVEIGAVPLNTVAGDVRILDMPDLAGLNPTIQQARRVAQALEPELNRQLERLGVRLIAMAPYPAQVLFCRDRVNSLADLRGKRIRTGGGSINDFVTAVGGQAVGIGFPEVYGALERGVVDCAITGTGSGNGARWYEVTTHMYALPVAWSTYGYFVNLAWWNRLDAPTRELLTTTFRELEDAQWALGDEATEDGINCNIGQRQGCSIGRLVENRPMTVTRATPQDLETLRGILQNNVLPAFVQRCGAGCAETYNRLVAPISGVRAEAR
ncbi:TRAP transporter substrate-binding protein [Falsiroseomonas oryziterrae]|uniref:TRAP transporter substrate-binding protein n=1 Tax=Falsiroseomonas oryziterrae TaxID=2911368 RepID=UPI001F3CE3F7|nr:TRAP transporter substrate-binding protein [Roseomonas sp. NPKOSM-4]